MSIFSRLPINNMRTAHHLVELTCKALEKSKPSEIDGIPLQQCFQMLEQYRYDAFCWRDSHVREDQFERANRENGQEGLRTALQKTAQTVFPGLTPEQVAIPIEEALTLFAKRKKVDLADAKKFFTQLKVELHTFI